eukprot:TRINITY_DN27280_c0_g1_i1.p1 TRINITY_DN27280_c0_g1~~TRINITY_DN27280_c0_g1_i1.p1  ORF type:complete len:470 (+),score=84.63 TRINITY_DN27280_c0_g1_i1:268-1677(+)
MGLTANMTAMSVSASEKSFCSRGAKAIHGVGIQKKLTRPDGSARLSRTKAALLARGLARLSRTLSKMDLAQRRDAISKMPSSVREALLEHMTQSKATATGSPKHLQSDKQRLLRSSAAESSVSAVIEPVAVAAKSYSSPKRTRCSSSNGKTSRCKSLKTKVESQHKAQHSGVRSIRPGAFQASVCFSKLIVRSATTRCKLTARKWHTALSRIRDLACDGSSDDSFEERFLEAKGASLAEFDLSELELKPSFATYVSSGALAGTIESPTTKSLGQALHWRLCLAAARQAGWPELRAAWVEILSSHRIGVSRAPLTAAAASERVDMAWHRFGARRAHIDRRGQVRLARQAIAKQRLLVRKPQVQKLKRTSAKSIRLQANPANAVSAARLALKMKTLLEPRSMLSQSSPCQTTAKTSKLLEVTGSASLAAKQAAFDLSLGRSRFSMQQMQQITNSNAPETLQNALQKQCPQQ